MIRRRMMMQMTQEVEEVKEWTTIADVVTTEEITNPSYDVDEDCNYREFAVYAMYNANEAQTASGYVKVELVDVNGTKATVQTMAGVPKTGYYRCVFHIILGNTINLYDASASNNTSLTPTGIYGSTETVLTAVKKINVVSYANIGVGSKIKIMAR